MTVLKEYRIVMPVTLEEFKRAHRFSCTEVSRENTGGGEGVEVLVNQPFDDGTRSGNYTHKILHVGSRLPSILKKVMPTGSSIFHEKCWNSFPHCRTVITNPDYMKDNFEVTITTINKPYDLADSDNVHGLSNKQLAEREVVHIDIGDPSQVGWRDYEERYDPGKFENGLDKSRSALKPEWLSELKEANERYRRTKNSNYEYQPAQPKFMCSYKLVSIKFKWYGLQKVTETFLQSEQRRVHTIFHRMVYCLMNRWQTMTDADVEAYEKEVEKTINEELKKGEKKGQGIERKVREMLSSASLRASLTKLSMAGSTTNNS